MTRAASTAAHAVRKRPRPVAEIHEIMPLYDYGGSHYVGYRMALAGKLFDRCISDILARHCDLSLPQWRVLAQLGLLGEATVRSLSNGAAVDRAEVSRALTVLEAGGLVERRENISDRRSPLFSLTTAGRALYLRVRCPLSRFMKNLVKDVDGAVIETANRLLLTISRGCIEYETEQDKGGI